MQLVAIVAGEYITLTHAKVRLRSSSSLSLLQSHTGCCNVATTSHHRCDTLSEDLFRECTGQLLRPSTRRRPNWRFRRQCRAHAKFHGSFEMEDHLPRDEQGSLAGSAKCGRCFSVLEPADSRDTRVGGGYWKLPDFKRSTRVQWYPIC